MRKKTLGFLFMIFIVIFVITSCASQNESGASTATENTDAKSGNAYAELSVKEFCAEYNIMDFHDDWGAVAVDDGNERNAMLVSWCAIGYMWDNPTFTVYIFKDRFTQHILDNAQYFSVSIFHNDRYDKSLLYLGSTSGKNEDKFKGCGLNVTEINGIPCFADADYIILCRKAASVDFVRETMESFVTYNPYYDEYDGVHRIFEGHIVQVLKNTNTVK